MPLELAQDTSPAAWFVDAAHADPDWTRPISRGPAGFEAYAVVHHRLVPGEQYGVADRLVREDGDLDLDLLRELAEVLASHTTTPQECWFCLWEGYGSWTSALSPAQRRRARVEVPHREYLLFGGSLREAGDWGLGLTFPWGEVDRVNSPNLFWPADRAWCVATEVDSEWTGVAGTGHLLRALVADDGLDVEAHEPARHSPWGTT